MAATGRLNAIVGRWRTDGQVIGNESAAVIGTDVYELFPGGHFLVHHVDVIVGDRPVRAIEIIGEADPDARQKSEVFLARAYDDTGAMTVMRVQIDDAGVWHFTGGPEIAPAAQFSGAVPVTGRVRSTLTVAADGTAMTAFWERSDDGGTWIPWMEIKFTRLPG